MHANKQYLAASSANTALNRELGRYGDDASGPILIIIGGMHGNEKSGVEALDQVLGDLYRSESPFSGMFLGLRGNLKALAENQRFIDVDFNRIWTSARIRELRENGRQTPAFTAEDREQIDLYETIRSYLEIPCRDVFLLDLHTTSAESAPFVIMSDTLRNRRFANAFPVPAILGMEEHFVGTLINHLDDLGLSSVAFEAGQHEDPVSVDLQIAAIWTALAACGCMEKEDIPQYDKHRYRMIAAARNLERVYEIRYRHEIHAGETFEMKPGYANFQKLSPGEELAEGSEGSITCHMPGNIFMPLYQSQGTDGYFIIRRVRYMWLTVSKWLRYARLSSLLPYLPGIRKATRDGNELVAHRRVCRWFVLEIFHLCGFRRKRYDADSITFIKRRYDP